MKILVTGSSGFIGSELVSALNGHEVITFDISEGQDINDLDMLEERMVDCDVVVHLAAYPKPLEDKAFSDYWEVNCQGTFNVAQAACRAGVKRLVYASSTSYYGAERGTSFSLPLDEESPILTQFSTSKNISCRDCDISYSTSKVIGEQILANFGLLKHLQVIILRLGPTRRRGEHRPFMGLHLKIDNAVHALKRAVESENQLWYEAFTITDDIQDVPIDKARELLGYAPE